MADTFEFDPLKSAANLDKRGMDFDRAQALWQDPDLVEVKALTVDEPRWLAIGQIEGRFWTAVFTRRGASIWLISVRRSREKEVACYEGA